MTFRIALFLAPVFLIVSPPTVLLAAEWYVDGSVASSGDGTSWANAFQTIQEGINASNSGDTVTVAEGVYVENIEFKGRNIILTSRDPTNQEVRNSTVIDGNDAGTVVRFSGEEDETCVLKGLTIGNGFSYHGPGGIDGGGMAGSPSTRAIIEYNLITGNQGASGGGLGGCAGTIRNNYIIANTAEASGGGLFLCGGTIRDNAILVNSAGWKGGGFADCHGLISDNGIRNNDAGEAGGGLYNCGGDIRANEITSNFAPHGGGLASCNGRISGNWIRRNSTGGYRADGGGLYSCHGTILWNSVEGNSSEYSGGGLGHCDGIIRSNTIHGNSAAAYGGGLSECNATIENNRIRENWAGVGGGLYSCDRAVRSNVIVGNAAREGLVEARGEGGGLAWCEGTIENNTIIGNTADRGGGGLDGCYATIRNCIIWGNVAPSIPQVHHNPMPRFCCIQDWTGGGEGNTTLAPLFVDPDGRDNDLNTFDDNDYRLVWRIGDIISTACIDTGENRPWMQGATDQDGNLRIYQGLSSPTVDMGAYEYGSWLFKVVAIRKIAGGQTELTWYSRPFDTYVVLSRPALHYPGPVHVPWAERATVSSQGFITSWTDSAMPYATFFYRVELEL